MAAAKLFILDCCYAGGFKGVAEELGSELSGKGRFVLSAASPTEEALDSGIVGAPSPFTAVLVDALNRDASDLDDDGHIDLEDVFRSIRDRKVAGAPKPFRNFDGTGSLVLARRPKRGTEADRVGEHEGRNVGAGEQSPRSVGRKKRGDISYADPRLAWLLPVLAILTGVSFVLAANQVSQLFYVNTTQSVLLLVLMAALSIIPGSRSDN